MTHYSKSHDTLSKEPLVKAPRYFIKRHMVKKNRNALWNEPLGKEPYYFLKRPIVKESQCILQWPTNQRATIIKYSKTVLPSVMVITQGTCHGAIMLHSITFTRIIKGQSYVTTTTTTTTKWVWKVIDRKDVKATNGISGARTKHVKTKNKTKAEDEKRQA